MGNDQLSKLQRHIGYTFNDISLLDLALTHRSFKSNNNERLEYLGDAILSTIVIDAFLLINDMIETDKVGTFFFLCMAVLVNVDLRNRRIGKLEEGE